MGHKKESSGHGFTADDVAFLSRLLRTVQSARVFQRVQAVRLVAGGTPPDQVSHITGLSRRSVYRWAEFYRQARQHTIFDDLPRSGRPQTAPEVTAERLEAELQYASIDEAAERIEEWMQGLTAKQTLTKAGLLSKNAWLSRFSQKLYGPT